MIVFGVAHVFQLISVQAGHIQSQAGIAGRPLDHVCVSWTMTAVAHDGVELESQLTVLVSLVHVEFSM